MKGQVSIDALVTGAGLLAVSVVVIGAFYGIYSSAEKAVRLVHLKYLSQVIEDRMRTCVYVENAKIYAPYEINVLCDQGKLCYRDLCVSVHCNGGGIGKTFVVNGCRVSPV